MHLVCTVSLHRFEVATDTGSMRVGMSVPLQYFYDADGQEKAVNPVRSKAWDVMNRLYRGETIYECLSLSDGQ